MPSRWEPFICFPSKIRVWGLIGLFSNPQIIFCTACPAAFASLSANGFQGAGGDGGSNSFSFFFVYPIYFVYFSVYWFSSPFSLFFSHYLPTASSFLSSSAGVQASPKFSVLHPPKHYLGGWEQTLVCYIKEIVYRTTFSNFSSKEKLCELRWAGRKETGTKTTLWTFGAETTWSKYTNWQTIQPCE